MPGPVQQADDPHPPRLSGPRTGATHPRSPRPPTRAAPPRSPRPPTSAARSHPGRPPAPHPPARRRLRACATAPPRHRATAPPRHRATAPPRQNPPGHAVTTRPGGRCPSVSETLRMRPSRRVDRPAPDEQSRDIHPTGARPLLRVGRRLIPLDNPGSIAKMLRCSAHSGRWVEPAGLWPSGDPSRPARHGGGPFRSGQDRSVFHPFERMMTTVGRRAGKSSAETAPLRPTPACASPDQVHPTGRCTLATWAPNRPGQPTDRTIHRRAHSPACTRRSLRTSPASASTCPASQRSGTPAAPGAGRLHRAASQASQARRTQRSDRAHLTDNADRAIGRLIGGPCGHFGPHKPVDRTTGGVRTGSGAQPTLRFVVRPLGGRWRFHPPRGGAPPLSDRRYGGRARSGSRRCRRGCGRVPPRATPLTSQRGSRPARRPHRAL